MERAVCISGNELVRSFVCVCVCVRVGAPLHVAVRTAVLIVFVRACGDCVCACVYAVSFWLARWLVTL